MDFSSFVYKESGLSPIAPELFANWPKMTSPNELNEKLEIRNICSDSTEESIEPKTEKIVSPDDQWNMIREAYISVKSWHENTRAFLTMRRVLIGNQIEKLLAILKQKADEIQTYVNYFVGVINHERESVSFHTKTTNLMQSLSVSYEEENVLRSLSDSVHKHEREEAFKRKEFIKFMETMVTNELKKMSDIYIQCFNSLSGCYNNSKKEIDSEEKRIEKLYQEFCETFHFFKKSLNKDCRNKKDLWIQERVFVRNAFGQIVKEKEFGELYERIYNEAKKLEYSRLEMIKKGFHDYFIKRSQTFGVTDIEAQTLKNVTDVDTESSVKEVFSLKRLADSKNMELFENIIKFFLSHKVPVLDLQSMKYDEFKSILMILDFKEAPKSLIAMKEGELERNAGAIINIWKKCHVVITLQRHIHIFEEKNQEKPVLSLDLSTSKLKLFNMKTKGSDLGFELSEKKKMMRSSKKHKVLLRVENQQQYTEWLIALSPPQQQDQDKSHH